MGNNTFAMEANFEKSNDRLKLKISLTEKRQKWVAGLWDSPNELAPKIPIV